MVTTAVITFVLSIFRPIVDQLPTVDLSNVLYSQGAETFMDWVSLAGYMLPMDTFFTILSIIVSLQIFRIVVAFFKSLWGVLPLA